MLRANSRKTSLPHAKEPLAEQESVQKKAGRVDIEFESSKEPEVASQCSHSDSGGLSSSSDLSEVSAKPSQTNASSNKRLGSLWNTREVMQDEEWDAETESTSEDGFTSITPRRQAGINPTSPPGGGQRGSWLTSSVSKLIWGWGKAPEKTLATEEVGVNNACEQASCLFVPSAREGLTEKELEGVLLWQNPVQSGRIFGLGLYLLVCIRQLVNGVELVQPSTVIATALLCILVYNTVRKWWQPRLKPQQQHTQEQWQNRVNMISASIAKYLGDLLSASARLLSSHLSGGNGRGSTLWMCASLWSIILIGEWGLMSQATLCIFAWAAIFTIPLLYTKCWAASEALLDEALAFLLSMLQGGHRSMLIGAALLSMSAFALTEAKLVTRISLSGLIFLITIFWRAHYIKLDCSRQSLKSKKLRKLE